MMAITNDEAKCKVLVMPDAAIMAWPEGNVVVTKDMVKCVLLTCLSALDLRELVVVTTEIMIPLLVLGDENALHNSSVRDNGSTWTL
jgi:hypothetical protein